MRVASGCQYRVVVGGWGGAGGCQYRVGVGGGDQWVSV